MKLNVVYPSSLWYIIYSCAKLSLFRFIGVAMWHELKVDSVTTVYLHENGNVEIEIDEGNGYYACKRSSYIKASVLSSWLATAMAAESARTDAQQTNGGASLNG
jgi:hypothetical protein